MVVFSVHVLGRRRHFRLQSGKRDEFQRRFQLLRENVAISQYGPRAVDLGRHSRRHFRESPANYRRGARAKTRGRPQTKRLLRDLRHLRPQRRTRFSRRLPKNRVTIAASTEARHAYGLDAQRQFLFLGLAGIGLERVFAIGSVGVRAITG